MRDLAPALDADAETPNKQSERSKRLPSRERIGGRKKRNIPIGAYIHMFTCSFPLDSFERGSCEVVSDIW